MYSYQDCWNYAFSLTENDKTETIKNDIITICQTNSKDFWLNFFRKNLTNFRYSVICNKLTRLINENYPIPYLVNQVAFYNLTFGIKKGVFIPQKDTELLIEKTLEISQKHWPKTKNLKILDIGTGCGNIAISLANCRPGWNFTATDISENALKIAKKNAFLQQTKNIEFCQSNLFANLEKRKFNIIVANPPYVSEKEYYLLTESAKQQPLKALVAMENGYWFYQQIIQQVPVFLTTKFLLVLEIGYQQAKRIIKIILRCLGKVKIKTFNDYGGQPRLIVVYNF